MTPLPFEWDGEAMRPLPAYARRADKLYTVGERYILDAHEQRSAASHRHYFAAIREAWATMPEHETGRFPNPEALRKWALIRAGHCDTRTLVASSKAEAERLAAFTRPMDHEAIVVVRDALVTVYTPRSQSSRAMDKQTFQKSKDDVLNVIADLLGTDAATLAKAGEAA
jgi:hypothetical protein